MSKETSNSSFNERPSMSGNSGMLGFSNLKPRLQPVRIKALLENYTSDEEDSEERGKNSSDSEDEDVQPLPDDEEKKPFELCLSRISEQKESSSSFFHSSSKNDATRETSGRKKHEKLEQNFCQAKVSPGEAIFSESTTNVACEEAQNLRKANRRSNVQLEIPQISENPTTSGKTDSRVFFSDESRTTKDSAPRAQARNAAASVYSSFSGQQSSRSDSKTMISESQSGHSRVERSESSLRSLALVSKAETMFPGQEGVCGEKKMEPAHAAKERHHSAPETYSSERCGQDLSHVNDTPMKNNPPAGSMRPTPSTSHRSIFQTPRNSKMQQDYSQNHVQTPATILSNWSQMHMAQTPLRSAESCPESGQRTRGAPIVSQGHELPLFGKIEEKRTRRPLAETSGSSRGNNRRSEKEKSSMGYCREILASSKSFETHRPVCERGNEPRETKENRRPSGTEKSSQVEESSVRGSELKKETISSYENQRHNENPSEKRISNGPTYDPHPPNFPVANPVPPAPQRVPEKKEIPERQNNVQISVPGRPRRAANPGQTITVKDKEYLILGSLGEGMSSHVLRVQELGSLGLRAIKVVDLSRLDKDCSQGCLEEITMLVKLQGPSIIKMFDHEINYPMVHVVMEMGDTDLRSLLNATSAQKRLPLTMILYYWTEMLSAVKHIHDHGVIHSDLKPANFLLVRGRLKLIDFGISSSINADMTSVFRNNPVGTLNYISPEALMDISGNNEDSPTRSVKYKISFKSDVWSLGCILYSLVFGYTPFHHIRAQWAKINAITNPKPNISFAPPTGADVEPTPPVLIDVMRKCLQHDPKARPTVQQLLQIPYIPIKPASPKPVRKIQPNILMKIKYALTEAEWRLFTEVLEDGGNQ